MMTPNNPRPIPAIRCVRKGAVLISIIAVMLVMGVLGVSVISLTQSSEHSYLSANSGSRAYYLAESGLRYAQQSYCGDGWLHGRERTLSLQGGEQVHVIRIGPTFWATAVTDAGTAQQARARVPMPLSLCGDDSAPNTLDDFAVFGKTAISLGNSTMVRGDVAITGDNVDIKGDVDGDVLARDVEFTAHGTVKGDIYSSGLVDIKVGNVLGDIHAANGILLRSANASVGGWLFSHGSIELGGSSHVQGQIHSCGGNVTLDGSSSVGTAAEPGEIRASGNVTLGGSVVVYGDVHAGGSISVGSGTIHGNAYAGGSISGTVTGTTWANSPGHVKEAICPDLSNLEDLNLPDATVFSAGGNDIDVKKSKSTYLPPGSYDDLTTPNNAKGETNLYLNAGSTDHGNYYFNSFSLGKDMSLYLNLAGPYDINIFVVGNIDVGSNLNVFVSTNGSAYYPMFDIATDPLLAARIYWESSGNFSLGSSSWFGSVYTPVGSVSAGNGSYLIGSYFSGGGHSFQKSTIVHVAPNYFTKQ